MGEILGKITELKDGGEAVVSKGKKIQGKYLVQLRSKIRRTL